ncbi:hypothetical protein PVAND_005778 [Polypedilum vanderplanki]|uniref:Receptor protein-tyrosine kinase n=1 Tax=Polypedilum vanderplanki TaxID=319348 RepID=A0A9J6C1J4_POLVA|nr:hypothetical protein PVAND_005778 [Polypedilum vanderplanki]
MENLRIAFGICLLFYAIVTINSEIIELSEKVVHVGESIKLPCITPHDQIVRDFGEVFYRWTFNNERISNDEHHEQRDGELILKNAHEKMTGIYGCMVELKNSGARFETSKRFIKVIDLRNSKKKEFHDDKLDSACNFRIPKLCRNKRNKKEETSPSPSSLPISSSSFKFTPKPTNKNFELGSSSKIHCKANGSIKIYWIKEGEDKLPEDVDDINGTLIFNNVVSSQKGIYTCIASNGEETIQHSIEVGLLPHFEIPPQEYLEVVEMQSVIIDCVGSDNSNVKWDFETTIINSENDERFHIFENGSLLLHEARQDDSGKYGCTIGNSGGFKRSESHVVIKPMDSHSSFEESDEESSLLVSKAVIMTCLVALIYISLVVALMLWCRHKRQKSRSENDPENTKENDDTASDGDEKEPLNHDARSSSSRKHKDKTNSTKKPKPLSSQSFMLVKDHLMIRYDQLIDLTKIGCGEFGEILIGSLNDADLPTLKINNISSSIKENGTDEIRMQQQIRVLVKSISKNKDDKLFSEFRRQIDLYRAIDSQNVVKIFGLCLEKDLYFMILEHYDRDLKSYLIENPETSLQQLLKYCRQIASGVNAIIKSNLTHRDVAIRNCIITSECVIKLSTIASHNNTNEYYKYNDQFLPLRHLAPEILDSFTYTKYSDIYSCGITLWEIFHQETPFKFITSNEEFFKKLQEKSVDYSALLDGDAIPSELQKTLKKCWTLEPSERLTSDDLINSLDELIAQNNGKNIS